MTEDTRNPGAGEAVTSEATETPDYTKNDRHDLAYAMRDGINARAFGGLRRHHSAKPGVEFDDGNRVAIIHVRDLDSESRGLRVRITVEEVE